MKVPDIKLPPPQTDITFPLMKALEQRRSKRRFSGEPLSLQQISNILWAACGISLTETKRSKNRRTVPSASNSQEISVYIIIESGVFLYHPDQHSLKCIKVDDLRSDIGTQKMMKNAPLGLVYVSDYSKLKKYLAKNDDRKYFVSGTDTGFISQNVYLYCTAAGLNTCIIGFVDREKLHSKMGLAEQQKIIYTQAAGCA